jgi:hypothetical protein
MIKKISFLIVTLVAPFNPILAKTITVNAPQCYQSDPVSCSFDDMTLSLCESAGKTKFIAESRQHVTGGNSYTSNEKKTCLVKHVKNSEPSKYTVDIK